MYLAGSIQFKSVVCWLVPPEATCTCCW